LRVAATPPRRAFVMTFIETCAPQHVHGSLRGSNRIEIPHLPSIRQPTCSDRGLLPT
jgi:hypothetical protein